MTALLRPAAEADLNEVVRIERSCFADPWSEESFRRLLAGDPAIFQVLVLPPENRIAGYVIAFAIGGDAELLNVAVEPQSRGKGFAGQMLDAVLIDNLAGVIVPQIAFGLPTTVIILVPNFVASIYGMNFTHLFPPSDWEYGFAIVVAVTIDALVTKRLQTALRRRRAEMLAARHSEAAG